MRSVGAAMSEYRAIGEMVTSRAYSNTSVICSAPFCRLYIDDEGMVWPHAGTVQHQGCTITAHQVAYMVHGATERSRCDGVRETFVWTDWQRWYAAP